MDSEAMKSRALDALTGVGASVIPVVGGVLSNLVSGENLRRFQQDIVERLEELAEKIALAEGAAERIFSTAEGRAAFKKVADAVSIEAHEEKRRLLANALLGAYGTDSRVSKRDYFLALVIAYEPEAIETLVYPIARVRRGDSYYPSTSWVRTDNAPHPHYVGRLDADGLVDTKVISLDSSHDTPGDTPTEHRYIPTQLAYEFLELIDPGFLHPEPVAPDGR